MSLRVVLLTNIPTPYRRPLFSAIGAQPGLELKILYNAPSEANRRWAVPTPGSSAELVLRGVSFTFGRRDVLALHANYGVGHALKAAAPNVVVLGGYNSLAHVQTWRYCVTQRIPYVLWSGSTLREANPLRRLASPLIRMIVEGASSYVAYGSRAADYLLQMGANQSKMFLAYNTVDTTWFSESADRVRSSRREIRNELGVLPDEFALLYVGQLIERKGVRDLLACVRQLRATGLNTRLLVAGRGRLERQLAMESSDLPVNWLGFVPIEKLPSLYVGSDGTVLPSREEVWGLVVNEAMACGSPVVATDACGASADLIVDGETGFLARANDSASLSSAISRLVLSRPEERVQVAARALSRISRDFTIEAAAGQFARAITFAGDSIQAQVATS